MSFLKLPRGLSTLNLNDDLHFSLGTFVPKKGELNKIYSEQNIPVPGQ
jgi:hypothetical protein